MKGLLLAVCVVFLSVAAAFPQEAADETQQTVKNISEDEPLIDSEVKSQEHGETFEVEERSSQNVGRVSPIVHLAANLSPVGNIGLLLGGLYMLSGLTGLAKNDPFGISRQFTHSSGISPTAFNLKQGKRPNKRPVKFSNPFISHRAGEGAATSSSSTAKKPGQLRQQPAKGGKKGAHAHAAAKQVAKPKQPAAGSQPGLRGAQRPKKLIKPKQLGGQQQHHQQLKDRQLRPPVGLRLPGLVLPQRPRLPTLNLPVLRNPLRPIARPASTSNPAAASAAPTAASPRPTAGAVRRPLASSAPLRVAPQRPSAATRRPVAGTRRPAPTTTAAPAPVVAVTPVPVSGFRNQASTVLNEPGSGSGFSVFNGGDPFSEFRTASFGNADQFRAQLNEQFLDNSLNFDSQRIKRKDD